MELEGDLRTAYNGLGDTNTIASRKDLWTKIDDYEAFTGGPTGLTKHISRELNGIEKEKEKKASAGKRKNLIADIEKASGDVAALQGIENAYRLDGGKEKIIFSCISSKIKEKNAFDYYDAADDSFQDGNFKVAAQQAWTSLKLFDQLNRSTESISARILVDKINLAIKNRP